MDDKDIFGRTQEERECLAAIEAAEADALAELDVDRTREELARQLNRRLLN